VSRRLQHYARFFDTVEVNATFYRLPKPESVARWAEQTPPGFAFAVKVSRYLTHVKRLADIGPGLERFCASIEPLLASRRLGPLLWQLPPTFGRDDERLGEALARLPKGLRHAFEFRDASWFHRDVFALLREHGAALVLADGPGSHASQGYEPTTDFTFVRFHAGSRGWRGNYSEAELRSWAHRLAGWSRRGDVWAYFNNDWEGFAPRNARSLVRKLPAGSGRKGEEYITLPIEAS
jgi:uncharacterized protein YecE (DUF72 family)